MATGTTWEFDCPQFIDFTSGDGSPKDDVFSGGPSPGLKMCNTLSIPKEKPSRPVPVCPIKRYGNSVNTTDAEKVIVQSQMSKRLSKSDGAIHLTMKTTKASANETSGFPRLERTVSESFLRFKCKTGPTTPMCLKRTLVKTKNKKIKTTEELELEKIAQLQMQTKMHLRANELTMMRRRQKPSTMQKEVPKMDLKVKEIFYPPKVSEQKNLVIPKLNIPRKIRSPQAPRSDAKAILTREIERMKSLNPPNPVGDRMSRALCETNHWNRINPKHIWPGKDGVNSLKEKNLIRSYDAHSGITLSASREKSIATKSSVFSTKPKEFGIALNMKKSRDNQLKSSANQKGPILNPFRGPSITGKENVGSRSFYFPNSRLAPPKMVPVLNSFRGPSVTVKENVASRSFHFPGNRLAQPKMGTANRLYKISKEI